MSKRRFDNASRRRLRGAWGGVRGALLVSFWLQFGCFVVVSSRSFGFVMGFGCAFRDAIRTIIYNALEAQNNNSFLRPKSTTRFESTKRKLVSEANNENAL